MLNEMSNKLQVASCKPTCSRTPYHVLRIVFLTLTLFLLWTLSACTTKVSGDEPPIIAYGQDTCDHCGMIIEEARFAAAYVTSQGDVRHFDDIGDMVSYYQEAGEEVHVFWAHDYTTEEWLKASEAYFVVSEDLHTPMGSGIVAAANQNAADGLAAEWGGEVLTFDALLAKAQAGLMEGKEHHHHAISHEHGG